MSRPLSPSRLLPVLLLLSAPAAALEPMLGADLSWVRVDVAGETFSPFAARAHLGLGLTSEWEVGVVAGGGFAEDEEVNVTTEAGSLGAVYVRFGASLGDSGRISLMGGYGEIELDVATPLAGYPGAQTYSGGIYGISLEERLSRWPNWVGSLDYERWYDDQGLTIDLLSYGFRYAF